MRVIADPKLYRSISSAVLMLGLLNICSAEGIDIHSEDNFFERIELKVSPRNYWQKRIQRIINRIELSKSLLRDLALERKRILATKDIDLAEAANGDRDAGDTEKTSVLSEWEDIKAELLISNLSIQSEQEVLARNKAWLEIARDELSKLSNAK